MNRITLKDVSALNISQHGEVHFSIAGSVNYSVFRLEPQQPLTVTYTTNGLRAELGEVQPLPMPAAPVNMTDLATRLLKQADDYSGPSVLLAKSDLVAICEESNRNYSGMLNWKRSAEQQVKATLDAATVTTPEPVPKNVLHNLASKFGRVTGASLAVRVEFDFGCQLEEFVDAIRNYKGQS